MKWLSRSRENGPASSTPSTASKAARDSPSKAKEPEQPADGVMQLGAPPGSERAISPSGDASGCNNAELVVDDVEQSPRSNAAALPPTVIPSLELPLAESPPPSPPPVAEEVRSMPGDASEKDSESLVGQLHTSVGQLPTPPAEGAGQSGTRLALVARSICGVSPSTLRRRRSDIFWTAPDDHREKTRRLMREKAGGWSHRRPPGEICGHPRTSRLGHVSDAGRVCEASGS